MDIVSSYEWYKLNQIIILLEFIGIKDYQINSSSSMIKEGFHLYVNHNCLEFVRHLLYRAGMENFICNK
jgi:hypothetical protein